VSAPGWRPIEVCTETPRSRLRRLFVVQDMVTAGIASAAGDDETTAAEDNPLARLARLYAPQVQRLRGLSAVATKLLV
jgi:hypothetical protein